MARARKKAVALDDPQENIFKPVDEAVTAFLGHCASEGLTDSTISKYRNALGKLKEFCNAGEVDSLAELTTEKLDRFRAGRVLKAITASKELEILRVFLGFCMDRSWVRDNAAKRIKPPRNIKPNEVVPFTAKEITAMVNACKTFGKSQYERLRVRAMILTLRYTALRIGDVSMLAKDRIQQGQ